MIPYPHIDSVYKRDERGKFIIGEFSRPEFEYLKDLPWTWTEKIDGTNIRIMYNVNTINAKHYVPYDGYEHDVPRLDFGGKTDNAQIPAKLVQYLRDTFSLEKMQEVFGDKSDTRVCLYGEGYGAGIQKGGGNYSSEQKFILFDVKIGNFWLERKNVEDIASKLGLDVVADIWPGGNPMSLQDMIYYVRDNVAEETHSRINPAASIEGYVGTPLVPLFARNGDRIITKIKYKDFK